MFSKYAPNNPSSSKPITASFAFSSLPHVIATFFGSGIFRPGSGTWGTLAAWWVFYLFRDCFSVPVWISIIVATFFIGAWASEITGKDIGVHDHSSIVIDEVYAIWIVQLTLPHTLPYQLGAFLAFRFFDIIKINPAGYFDTSPLWKNGFGVMLDDLVAAIQAILLMQIIKLFF